MDLRELAWRVTPGVASRSVDLICLMTYDQHTRWTPGPVAGWAWTTATSIYALSYGAREKLSLGIPLYGYHWFAGHTCKSTCAARIPPTDKPNPALSDIATDDALDLARLMSRVEGDRSTGLRGFLFIATTCANGFFSPTRTPFGALFAGERPHLQDSAPGSRDGRPCHLGSFAFAQ